MPNCVIAARRSPRPAPSTPQNSRTSATPMSALQVSPYNSYTNRSIWRSPVSIPIPSEEGMQRPDRRHQDGALLVSIPIPSEEGMQRRSNVGISSPQRVSIPIPSEEGMQQGKVALVDDADDVSIPIPSEEGMQR